MDVIREEAKQFSDGLHMRANRLEQYDSALNSKLLYINKLSEKLRFLSYLKGIVETKYQKHAKVCINPESCSENKGYEIALYAIQQQYDDYYEQTGGVISIEKPAMQFFSEGQYFDAYTAIKECIKLAKLSIILIDGYVDLNTLHFFPAKEPSVQLRIITKGKSMNAEFQREIDLYNKQYGNLSVKVSENYHDRFLVIDRQTYYHIGASIKDAGSKTFMFSQILDPDIIALITQKIFNEWPDLL